MPGNKHAEELNELASRVYEQAAQMIGEWCEKTYRGKKDSEEQQLEDYLEVAERASALLLGNALALTDPAGDEDELRAMGGCILAVADYVRAQEQQPN